MSKSIKFNAISIRVPQSGPIRKRLGWGWGW